MITQQELHEATKRLRNYYNRFIGEEKTCTRILFNMESDSDHIEVFKQFKHNDGHYTMSHPVYYSHDELKLIHDDYA